MRSVSIRIDDIDSQTPISGLESLHHCLEKFGGQCELSIIPFRHDETGNWLRSLLAFIEDKPRFNISLHGYSHIKRTNISEFFGLSRESQYDLISAGFDLLMSSRRFTKKFVPPWNSYDENTLLACKDVGIEIVGTSYKQYVATSSEIKIECISADFQEFLGLPRFYDLVYGKWHSNLMFHTYDFIELHKSGSSSINNLFNILCKREIEVINYKNINLDRLYAFSLMRKIRKKLPNRITPSIMKVGKRIK